MEFVDVMQERRSIRAFYPKPIEMEKVNYVIEAAIRAPSVGDLQPWKFIIVTKADKLQGIADACPYERWLYQAPLVIVICAMHDKTEQYYPGKGKLWSAHSCAAAAENALLAAVDTGLGACWVASFETQKIKELLHIPDGIEPEIMIALGYPDEIPVKKHVYPYDMNVLFNDYSANNVDRAMFMKDFGLHFRNKFDDVKTRAAYETAEKGGLRTSLENFQNKLKESFGKLRGKKPEDGSSTHNKHHHHDDHDDHGGHY